MNCRYKRPHASVRLICFPWAGGDTSFYASWGKHIADDIEVSVVCQAGRDSRSKEPLCTDGEKTIEEMITAMEKDYFDKPFAFCGHSAGSFLAFRLAVELKKRYNKEPELIIFSGAQPPHSQSFRDLLKNTDDHFVARISDKSIGGVSAEVLKSSYMQETFMPLFKADLSVMRCMTYEHQAGDPPPLSCPFGVFVGREDDPDLIRALDEWKELTRGRCIKCLPPGNHFFLTKPEGTKQIVSLIEQFLEDV